MNRQKSGTKAIPSEPSGVCDERPLAWETPSAQALTRVGPVGVPGGLAPADLRGAAVSAVLKGAHVAFGQCWKEDRRATVRQRQHP